LAATRFFGRLSAGVVFWRTTASVSARVLGQLDDSLAEAHATLGLIKISSREWPKAAAEFRRTLELSPNYATAHHWYAYYLRFANRLDEACAELEIARQLDPDNPATIAQAGFTFAVGGETAEATRLLAILKDAAARNINVSMYAAMVEAGLGRRDEALSTLEQQARSPNGKVLQGIQHWYAFERLRLDFLIGAYRGR